jgi:hypothetical protein
LGGVGAARVLSTDVCISDTDAMGLIYRIAIAACEIVILALPRAYIGDAWGRVGMGMGMGTGTGKNAWGRAETGRGGRASSRIMSPSHPAYNRHRRGGARDEDEDACVLCG